MKQILVIDENPAFREYLKTILSGNGLMVTTAFSALDGISKIRTEIPDLIILDYHLSREGCLEALQAKKSSPNTFNIPVIITARQIEHKKLAALLPYNVKKIFYKPVKTDTLFATLSEILQVSFTVDESPGIVEAHINEDIIFIELAQGLNRDKLDMLKYKIMELIDLNSIKVPKLIVMLSDIVLSSADIPNLQKLLIVLQASRTKNKYIRILTKDDFVKKYIGGKNAYQGIEVVSNLQYAVDGLLADMDDIDDAEDQAEKKAELIGDKVLSGGGGAEGEAMMLRFDAESRPKKIDAETTRDFLTDIFIAVVDDDPVILESLKNAIREAGGNVSTYNSGAAFLEVVGEGSFDIIFLDLLMSGIDGFTILTCLNGKNIQTPVIVLSGVTERETVLRAFRLGIKGYITKPVQPDEIIRKAIEILGASI
jgi:CheY-like chemotaxis protein